MANQSISKPRDRTRRAILAHSGNLCAFPTCTKPVFRNGEMTGVGQIAHIEAANSDGPRYNPQQSPEDRHGYDNLMAVCMEHGPHIDDPSRVSTYTVEVLCGYKIDHEKKVERDADRNWILPPNSITGGSLGGTTVHFWIDRNGNQRVYSDRQLAICSSLLELNLDISKIGSLYQVLHTINEPMVKSLLQQDYAKIGDDPDNLFAHLAQIMASFPEVTFGEFLRFLVQGNDATALVDLGEKRIAGIIDGNRKSFWKNPQT